MNLKKGKVYYRKDQCSGYFMVMGFEESLVKVSSLFWSEDITYQYKRKKDMITDYKVHKGNVGNPTIEARYDHEKMRRINKL